MGGLNHTPSGRYDEAVALTRLLAMAVEKIGGTFTVDETDFQSDDPAYVLQISSSERDGSMTLKARRLRKEFGEVLNVADLEEAESTDINSAFGTVFFRRHFRASANGVTVEHVTDNPSLKLWVSPILTMRTQGVALVNADGFMVAHSVKLR